MADRTMIASKEDQQLLDDLSHNIGVWNRLGVRQESDRILLRRQADQLAAFARRLQEAAHA